MVRKEDLLKTLQDLREKEFEDFKWLLKDGSLAGYQTIKASQLEKAERRDTVDLMVQTYQLPGAVEVTKKLLKMINRNVLLQRLSDISSGPEAPTPRDAGITTSTAQDGSVINQPQLTGVHVGGHMKMNVSNTHATTQRDAGSTTSTAQNGSITNQPQLKDVHVKGDMNMNVSNTHVQPPARTDEADQDHSGEQRPTAGVTKSTTQRDAGSTTSTAQNGSITNQPKMKDVHVGGNMNMNVSNTHAKPPARTDKADQDHSGEQTTSGVTKSTTQGVPEISTTVQDLPDLK